ncbi:glutamate-rich WD repeat-containing protein 1, partial [Striga asiatica]
MPRLGNFARSAARYAAAQRRRAPPQNVLTSSLWKVTTERESGIFKEVKIGDGNKWTLVIPMSHPVLARPILPPRARPTNAEDSLLHGVQPLEQDEELADPQIAAVGVAAASGDDETVVGGDLAVRRKLAARHRKDVPHLALLPQHSHENPEVAAVDLLHVVGVLGAQKHGELPAAHSLSV